MKQFYGVLAAVVLMGGLTQDSFCSASREKLDDRMNDAKMVLDEIMSTPDRGIPQGILSSAACVVVIPHYKKAAFVIGGEYGQGVATCRTEHGWSAPVFVQLSGGSFGWQIGGQSTDLVLLAMNQDGLQHMLANKFKVGADASAAAGPVGRNAQAGTDWKLNAEFLTYSRSKGLFAGLDLSGTVLAQNDEDTRTVYGADVPFRTVLAGKIATPPDALAFVRAVAHYFVVSKQNK